MRLNVTPLEFPPLTQINAPTMTSLKTLEDSMPTPGATKSGLSPFVRAEGPAALNEARSSFIVVAPTPMTFA